MTLIDWIALVVVLLAALAGMRRGLILSAFSLLGLAVGAYLGARIAPHLLSGGARSVWTPFGALVGSVIGAGILQLAGVVAGAKLRGGLRVTPLRVVDSTGGFLLGIVTGLAIVWICAAVVTQRQTPTQLSREVLRSWIVQKLDDAVSPKDLPNFLSFIDPWATSINGPAPPTLPPSVGILRNHRIRSSLTRVVKVLGTACGRGVEGSGWFARGDLVVTAAHVVAGERSTQIEIPGRAGAYDATVVVFDTHNDIAVLLITGATERPLRLVDPVDGAPVVIAGYPLNGNLTAIPGRVGPTANAFTQDALGRNRVERAITAVAGRVEHGDSGGPVIDTRGYVEAAIFAAKRGSASGYAVPASIIRTDLVHAGRRAVSTETCAP